MSDTTTEPTTQVTTGDQSASQPVESVESKAVEAATEAPTDTTVEQPQEVAQQDTSDEVLSWAKKKGLPLSENPTDAELKLVNMQREAERRMHEATNAQSELKKSLDEQVSSADYAGYGVNAELVQEVTALKINQQLNEFYAANPDARQYDSAMAELVAENPNLANAGLEALYATAKHRAAVNEADTIKKEGAKQALENVALKQQAASVAGNATTNATPSNTVTRELLQQKLKEGDTKWVRENKDAINALTQI